MKMEEMLKNTRSLMRIRRSRQRRSWEYDEYQAVARESGVFEIKDDASSSGLLALDIDKLM